MNGSKIFTFLYKIGMGDVWQSPRSWDKEHLKIRVTSRLQNMFIQKYYECMNDMNNVDKCKITNICKNSMYSEKKNLSGIESSQIRSIFTKLRIYINSTWDSKVRSFRYKNVQSNQCTDCKSSQDIEDILLHCNHPDMISNRKTFLEHIANTHIHSCKRETQVKHEKY